MVYPTRQLSQARQANIDDAPTLVDRPSTLPSTPPLSRDERRAASPSMGFHGNGTPAGNTPPFFNSELEQPRRCIDGGPKRTENALPPSHPRLTLNLNSPLRVMGNENVIANPSTSSVLGNTLRSALQPLRAAAGAEATVVNLTLNVNCGVSVVGNRNVISENVTLRRKDTASQTVGKGTNGPRKGSTNDSTESKDAKKKE
ncbi:MAG: hypothetical protein M1837_000404 [Sclerophora amabilis]|nr:MAG: hypothetical protein M1837_000404 [Sclerophora amabilis]